MLQVLSQKVAGTFSPNEIQAWEYYYCIRCPGCQSNPAAQHLDWTVKKRLSGESQLLVSKEAAKSGMLDGGGIKDAQLETKEVEGSKELGLLTYVSCLWVNK